MKIIVKIILTILLFVLFFALLPSLPAAAGQVVGEASAASQSAAHLAHSAPFIAGAPTWAQILIAAVWGLMVLVALTPLFGQGDSAGETAGVIRS